MAQCTNVQVSTCKVDRLKDITGIWVGTQTEYDALTTKDDYVLYFIKE